MIREVIFDTETTGKRYQDNHRIVEIAAVEMIDGKLTGKSFHTLLNPEMIIPDEVIAIHGITNHMVANAPKFREVIPKLVDFFRGAVVIAHNSEFDEKFINHELVLAEHKESFWSIVEDTVDTIDLSRKIWRGFKDENGNRIKHDLDSVLDRCGIDRSLRVKHGALIDSELLASAYTSLKEKILEMGPTLEDDIARPPVKRLSLKNTLPSVLVSEEEEGLNSDILSKIAPPTQTASPQLKV